VCIGPSVGDHGMATRRRFLVHHLVQLHWDRKAGSWDCGASPGLEGVVAAVLETARPRPGMTAVDLGCGTGRLTLALARMGLNVIAVDISPVMLKYLREKATSAGLTGITCVVDAVEHFDLPPDTVDLVVSNYAFHFLCNRDQRRLLQAAAYWLRPGGRLVVGDMMFGRGGNARDWEIIGSKAVRLARRGPGGWWRIAKNLIRFSLRVGAHPMDIHEWERQLNQSGLADISVRSVVAEAGVAAATKPIGQGESRGRTARRFEAIR
jgi:SAM-dependent methyltransferase